MYSSQTINTDISHSLWSTMKKALSTYFTQLKRSVKFMSRDHQEDHVVDARVKSGLHLESFSIPVEIIWRTTLMDNTGPPPAGDIRHSRARMQRKQSDKLRRCTNSRPGLCWVDRWTQSSWTCLCRSVHTGSRRPTPHWPPTPQWAEWPPRPSRDLPSGFSWCGKNWWCQQWGALTKPFISCIHTWQIKATGWERHMKHWTETREDIAIVNGVDFWKQCSRSHLGTCLEQICS